MSIATEISKAQNNLKECYDACKSVDGVVLPDDKNFDNLPALIEQALNPFNKPTDWSDIRKDCPANSIALYAAHSADYSSYDNLGFTATCTGGYKVYIDGNVYGSYASGSTCNITWSTSGITTGDDITTPSALKAHKIWIEPATNGENITAFHCARVAASGTEQQGILWAHFNISNSIDATSMFGNTDNSFRQQVLQAITAKNNTLKIDTSASAFVRVCQSLTYLPVIDGQNNNLSNAFQTFADCPSLPNINVKNFASTILHATFRGARALNKLPKGIDYSVAVRMVDYLTNAVALEDTILDVSDATALKAIGCYGTSQYFMSGFKGLRVSSYAPFNYATSPQINVSYTGMDRQALVQLFNDLPTVNAGQIINITGTTGSEDLTNEDVLIAINKGWTVTGGPAPVQLYAYTDGNNNTIYTPDENLKGTYKALNTNDFTNNGITIDENGIASGFNMPSNTLTLNQTFNPDQYASWEINVKFMPMPTETIFSLFAQKVDPGNLPWQGLRIDGWTEQNKNILGYHVGFNTYAAYWAENGTLEWNLEQWNISNVSFTGANPWHIICKLNGQIDVESDVSSPYDTTTHDQPTYIGTSAFDNRKLNGKIDLKETWYSVAGQKKTCAILNTTSNLYDSNFQQITPVTAENYNNVVIVDGTTYTRDTTKDTTAVL